MVAYCLALRWGFAEELVDTGFELVGVAGAESADGAARIDEHVRRYSPDSE